MQMRGEGVFDVSVYRRRFDYCNRGEGIFAHAKYRRKRGPAYIAFFLFFFFFRWRINDFAEYRRYRHRRRLTTRVRINSDDPFCIKARCFLQEGKGYSKFGIGIKGIRNFALATVTAEN